MLGARGEGEIDLVKSTEKARMKKIATVALVALSTANMSVALAAADKPRPTATKGLDADQVSNILATAGNNNSDNNNGNDNRFKVCDHNPRPQKCNSLSP